MIRGRKGVVLTEAGSALYRHAETILRQLESAKQAAKIALNLPSGRVSIGVPHTIGPILSYDLFMRVCTEHPRIVLHITDGNSSLLREQLLNGRIDLALLFEDQSARGLAVEPLLLEELFYVTADPDPSPIRIADAAQRPMIVPGPASASRRVAQEAFKRHGLNITPIGEVETVCALRRAVASGTGNAIEPWSVLYDGERTIALNYRRFADAKLTRPVALCFSEVGQRAPAVEAITETLKSLVRELVESGIWQGVSLIEPGREPAHALVPQ